MLLLQHQLRYGIGVDEDQYKLTLSEKFKTTPEAGINEATYLALFLNQFGLRWSVKAICKCQLLFFTKTLLVRSLAQGLQMRRWELLA